MLTEHRYTMNQANWVLGIFTGLVGAAGLAGGLYFLVAKGDRSVLGAVALGLVMVLGTIDWLTTRVEMSPSVVRVKSLLRSRSIATDDIIDYSERTNVAGARTVILKRQHGRPIALKVVAFNNRDELLEQLRSIRPPDAVAKTRKRRS